MSTREPPLQLQIGVHSGETIQNKDDFFGSVVNKAARIANAALPGEIRISETASFMAGSEPDLRYIDPVDIDLRGFEGSYILLCLGW